MKEFELETKTKNGIFREPGIWRADGIDIRYTEEVGLNGDKYLNVRVSLEGQPDKKYRLSYDDPNYNVHVLLDNLKNTKLSVANIKNVIGDIGIINRLNKIKRFGEFGIISEFVESPKVVEPPKPPKEEALPQSPSPGF